jgi:hypothetical protein
MLFADSSFELFDFSVEDTLSSLTGSADAFSDMEPLPLTGQVPDPFTHKRIMGVAGSMSMDLAAGSGSVNAPLVFHDEEGQDAAKAKRQRKGHRRSSSEGVMMGGAGMSLGGSMPLAGDLVSRGGAGGGGGSRALPAPSLQSGLQSGLLPLPLAGGPPPLHPGAPPLASVPSLQTGHSLATSPTNSKSPSHNPLLSNNSSSSSNNTFAPDE